MSKDFDKWNILKKDLNDKEREVFARSREIWWCSFGLNIGSEVDGKNEAFERVGIILKVYNTNSMFVLPVTTKEKNDKFHFKIKNKDKTAWVKLTQGKVISSKRLIRKVGLLNDSDFEELIKAFKESI